MVRIEKLGVVLSSTDHPFESMGVLNPAIIQEGNTIKMIYRAFKEGNFSTLGYCEFIDPTAVSLRNSKPIFIPEEKYEKHGVEDPRVVKIEDLYYLTYTGYDGRNALGCLAVSEDLNSFERKGIITPRASLISYQLALENNKNLPIKYFEHLQTYIDRDLMGKTKFKVWDKDVLLFPEKVNGDFFMLHRLLPGIQWVKFNKISDLNKEFWKEYLFELNQYILMDPLFDYENMHIGAGAPPVRTDSGWLMIYHSVQVTPLGRTYHASAAMLDLEDPSKVIARLPHPLFSPTEAYEKKGYINNVCFPTGCAIIDEWLYIYYGAADNTIALARVILEELVHYLLNFPTNEK